MAFIKNKDAQEGLIHICEGKSEKQMRAKKIEVLLHDISIYTIVYNDGDCFIEHLKFCPYCGCDLEKDAFPSDWSPIHGSLVLLLVSL